jgi:hypothetical protein
LDTTSILTEIKTYIRDYLDSKLSHDSLTYNEHFKILLDEINLRYEQKFAAIQLATATALTSAKEAVEKAERTADKWRESANEWRAAMGDKDKNFALRDDVIEVKKRIDSLEQLRDIASGKASQTTMIWTMFIALGALVSNIIQLVYRVVPIK